MLVIARIGSRPIVTADCFSLLENARQTTDKSKSGIWLFLHFQIVAQPLMWLMLITIALGMCLMNGYSVVKEQHPFISQREKQVKGFYPFTCFLT